MEHSVISVEDRVNELHKDVREIRNWGLAAVAFLLTAFAIGSERLNEKMDGGFVRLDERIQRLDQNMDERFIVMEEKFDRKFDAIDQRFGAMDQRFDAMDQQFNAIHQALRDLRQPEGSGGQSPPAMPSDGTRRRH